MDSKAMETVEMDNCCYLNALCIRSISAPKKRLFLQVVIVLI